MPRKRIHRKQKRQKPRGEYKAPNEVALGAAKIIETAIIPPFKSIMSTRYSFRFMLGTAVALPTAWTTTMLLDMYCIAVGGSASPVRLFNNIKILGLKLWSAPLNETGTLSIGPGNSIILEFSPSTTAGFGGAPRVPYVSTTLSDSKMQHLAVKPRPTELASQWFSAQQANYALWNLQAPPNTVIQIDLLATFVNGETPVACAYTTAVAKGTIGVTNFGIAGCRSLGLENLVNP